MVSAGPLANAALLGIFALVASRSAESLSFTAIAVQMLLANGYLLVWCLIPHYAKIDGARVPNDGLYLIHLVFGRPSKSWQHGHSDNSTETTSSSPSWTWAVKQVPPEALLAQYRQQLSESKLSSDKRHLMLDAFATCVLMYGSYEFLAEADRYSEELFQSRPDAWTVKGTRGSILIEKGDIEGGAAMLKDVIQHDPSSFDRAIAASFLALAELKQNNREAAVQWLRISRDFDPHCASMHRIEALLLAKVPSATSAS